MFRRKRKKIKPLKKIRRVRSKKIEYRNVQMKLKKNVFPLILTAVFFWTINFYLIYFVDPYTYMAIPVFFITLPLALLPTLSILFANFRRGVFASAAIVLFLILRYYGVGNIINFFLITGFFVTAEYYLLRK